MSKRMDEFADKFGAITARVEGWRYVRVIKNAFVGLLPLTIIGAFGVLLATMVFDADLGLAKIEGLGFLTALKPIANAASYATLSLMALYVVFFMGNELARINGENPVIGGSIAFACYIAATPTFTEVMSGNETITVSGVLASKYTDCNGMFIGMLVAVASVELWCWLGRQDRLKIKMPDSVPANVSESFSALIPTVVTVSTFAILGYAILAITGMYAYDILFFAVQQPLMMLSQGLPFVLILQFVAQFFWCFGIHGNSLINPVFEPITQTAIAQNAAAFQAGDPVTNIFTGPFTDMYMKAGGSGMILCLVIAIFIVSRRADYRAIAEIGLPCCVFNIAEPEIFGLPIVMNPVLCVPFVFSSLVTGAIGYFATAIGFAAPAVVLTPWPTPPIINAFLATGGSVGAVITQVVCIVVAVLIYIPFVMAMNKRPADNVEMAA